MKGMLFVISAPSGAGKTTLIRQVKKRFPSLGYSVSHTTRAPRPGEEDGKDYFFVTCKAFQALIDTGQMLEWAKVHDNYYGTSKAFIMERLSEGQDILLDIDVQGADQVMNASLPMVSIFIMPPSVDELSRRLVGRGTDSPGVIERRLGNARGEIARASAYDHVVVNDKLSDAVEELCRIFERAGCPR